MSVLMPSEMSVRREGLPAPSLDEKCYLCPWTHVLPLSPVYTPRVCRSDFNLSVTGDNIFFFSSF